MPYARWKDMIENIKDNGKADLHHTLNTIDLEDPDGLARSNDGYRRDAFYRFNQTFQYFFDVSVPHRHNVRLGPDSPESAARDLARGSGLLLAR